MNRDTICVQSGWQPKKGEARVLPIYQSTTFKYETSDQMARLFDLEEAGFFYTRLQNPTNECVAKKIAELEGGVAAIESLDYADMLFLNIGGSAGELSAVALIIGFIYLLARRVIKPYITLSIIATVAVFSGIFWAVNPAEYTDPVFNILTGGLLLGAIFMATDYVTSPMSNLGGIIFGVGIGLITMLIRYFGAYPEGISFAILIMNSVVPLLNKYIKPRRFGKEVKNG